MADRSEPAPEYPLGYTEREQQRLLSQARFHGELTERLFRRAGLQPRMSVLDIGCGTGDVSLLAAALVGPDGSVVGVDRATSSVALAQQRARAAGLRNVTFREGDLTGLDMEGQFDALVGRLVLLYLPDPAATLGRLLRFVRPGGLVIFQEMEMSMARAVPPQALFQACLDWIRETFRRAGFETDMGSRLLSTFLRAGLPCPQMALEGRLEGGAGSPAYDLMTETVRSLLPLMERLEVASPATVEVDTLRARLEDETCAGPGILIVPPLIGAWTRKAG